MSDKVLSQFKQEVVEEKKVSDKKLKIGIIGTGGIGGLHIAVYKELPGVEIIAAADLVPGKAKKAMEDKELYGVRCYENHKDMIDNEPELDAVSICTYNSQHAGPAIYALEHGINVLLEKPFTVTIDEAVEVMRAEKRTGKFVSVGFQPRFDPNMQMIGKIVKSGVLGKIYYIQTGGGRRRGMPGGTFIGKNTGGIGALGDIGCYSLDLVMNALGHPKPLTVSGYTSDFFGKSPKYNPDEYMNFEVDDFAAAFIRLEGDITLDFRISWAMHADTPGDTIIMGTEGALRIPSTDCWNGSVGGPMTLYHDVCGKQTETKIPLIDGVDSMERWRRKLGYFLDAVRENGTAPIPTSQILYNQAILDGIVRSAELGREIEIEIPEI